jgi:hypothetical protein
MQPAFASIARDALFERLARGHAGRLAVLTPNRRLASALARDFDDSRAAAGLAAWESADILPWASFVERLWDEALTEGLWYAPWEKAQNVRGLGGTRSFFFLSRFKTQALCGAK